MTKEIPISTQWLHSSVNSVQTTALNSAVLVLCTGTSSKGTGWVLGPDGNVVTANHVVAGNDIGALRIVTNGGVSIKVTAVEFDEALDLAILTPETPAGEPLSIDTGPIQIGNRVHTWGYPLGYSDPVPLLTVGYLAGFRDSWHSVEKRPIKHVVVNGAFNPGNSGGPLLQEESNGVIGVVITKHAPISQFHLSAIEALRSQKSGFMYNGTDATGKKIQFSEGQIVGGLLLYFRSMTQVVIGEAISAEELVAFLDAKGIAWEQTV